MENEQREARNGERAKIRRGMEKEQREAEEWRKSKEKHRNGE